MNRWYRFLLVSLLLATAALYGEKNGKQPAALLQYQIVDLGIAEGTVETLNPILNKEGNVVALPKKVKNLLKKGEKTLKGNVQGATNSGIVYGFLQEGSESKPAVWTESEGLTVMKNYRSKVVPDGTIRLESLAMTDEGVAYGTYWVEYKEGNPIVGDAPKVYYNFAWEPATGNYKQLDIDGMLVKKANNLHTLIGELNGKPALCEGGKKPFEMTALISPEQSKEWEILRLCDINDSNKIVGIGKYQGKVHLFVAEKI